MLKAFIRAIFTIVTFLVNGARAFTSVFPKFSAKGKAVITVVLPALKSSTANSPALNRHISSCNNNVRRYKFCFCFSYRV